MCDTFVSLATASRDNTVIFGKNSDRLSNEAQLITYIPRTTYSKGEDVQCTLKIDTLSRAGITFKNIINCITENSACP